MTPDEVRGLLRLNVEQCGSQKALAQKIGVTPSFLSDILHGRREPSGAVVSWLGLVRVVSYEEPRKPRRIMCVTRTG